MDGQAIKTGRSRVAPPGWHRFVFAAMVPLLLLLQERPAPAEAQVLPAAIGAAAGLAGGTYISLGLVVVRARLMRKYLEAEEELIGPLGIPALIGLGAGLTLGWTDQERLRHSIYGAAGGTALGAATGALIGQLFGQPPEGRWAGLVIGGATGLIVGSIVGAAIDPDPEETPLPASPLQIGVRVPLPR